MTAKRAPEPTRDPETQERILGAAHVIFLQRGMSGARMQDIADEAGVNKALLHYYFRSKERLALAVFRSAVGQILPRVYEILGSDASIEEKVRRIVQAQFAFLREHPYVPGYLIAEINYHPEFVQEIFGERGAPPIAVLDAQLKSAAAAGEIRSIAPEQFVANLMSLTLFPFAARPLLEVMMGLEGEAFQRFVAERAEMLPVFFLAGLRP